MTVLGSGGSTSAETREYMVKDVHRSNGKRMIANTLAQLKTKAAELFTKPDMPDIYLDDGTEVADDDYFQMCASKTEFIAVFSGEQWIPYYEAVSQDTTDSADFQRVHLRNIIRILKNNYKNVAILGERELEMIINLDPNTVADIIPDREYVEMIQEMADRFAIEKRRATEAVQLIKLIARNRDNPEVSGQ